MKRRDFIQLGLAGATLSTLNVSSALANTSQIQGAGGLFYTQENPGRWSGKIATHLPLIEIEKKDNDTRIKVTTPHEMNGFEHYIVKHILLDNNFQFIDEYLFNPSSDKTAISSFIVNNYKGNLHALSLCNKHDLWLNTAHV
jgi:superoxide reductase